jgi:hypothetical protein
MAFGRFVLTATVTLTGDALTAGSTGVPNGSASGTAAVGNWDLAGATFPKGTTIWADSAGGATGPGALYTAIGAGNLRAYVQGQDDVGHAGLAN